jgi:hypothetical protein
VDASVQVQVQEECAGIWLVGEGIAQRAETLTRAAAALRVTDLRLTSQGSSPLSVGFAVPEADLHLALEVLHQEFFSAPDTTAFAVAPNACAANLQAVSQQPAGLLTAYRTRQLQHPQPLP